MCGLVGAFRADNAMFDHKIKNFMEKGLYVSAVRGMEGTGVGIVGRDFNAGHAKSQFDSATFLQTRQYGFAKNAMTDARVVLGHTRHSTIHGSIAQENSHPFQWRSKDNEILLTHNGHINNAQQLSHKDFHHQVDSAHVANALLHNPDTNILEQMMGFYVCVWYDKKDRSVKMARNNTRDLYYVYNKAKTQIYYASEAEILKFVLDREEIVTEDEFHEIEPGKLLVWNLEAKTLDSPKEVNYKEKKEKPYSYQGQGTVGVLPRQTTSGANTGTGGSSGAGNSGRPFSTLGVNDPTGPAHLNDMIYMSVANLAANFVSNGKRLGVGEPAQPHPKDWGYLYGSRTQDKGSIVKIQLQRDEMEELESIKIRIPVTVTRATLTTKEDGIALPLAEHYWYYEAQLDGTKVRLMKHRAKKLADDQAAYKAAMIQAAEGGPGGEPTPLADGSPTEPATGTKEVGGTVVPFAEGATSLDLVPGPGPGKRITRKDWTMMAEMGCFFCQGQILPDDIGKVAFYEWPHPPEDHSPDATDYQIICPTCKKDCALGTGELTVSNSHNFGSNGGLKS